jgi:hypothetical protein
MAVTSTLATTKLMDQSEMNAIGAATSVPANVPPPVVATYAIPFLP